MALRLRALISLAVSAALSASIAATAPATPARSASRNVYVDGDSLAVGTGWYLGTYLRGWVVHETAVVSRHASEGALAVLSRRSSLERVVVVDLGTNDDPSQVTRFRSYIRDVVRAAGPGRCVIWSTISRPAYNGISYDGYNRAIVGVARAHSNVHVFDWAGMARAHPEWFGSDGVHPTNTGYKRRAAALARLIKGC